MTCACLGTFFLNVSSMEELHEALDVKSCFPPVNQCFVPGFIARPCCLFCVFAMDVEVEW